MNLAEKYDMNTDDGIKKILKLLPTSPTQSKATFEAIQKIAIESLEKKDFFKNPIPLAMDVRQFYFLIKKVDLNKLSDLISPIAKRPTDMPGGRFNPHENL